jgi:TIR domain
VSAPIFISYSSKDQDIAETIYRALEARGRDCWIACRDVQPGENYQEAIVRALRDAKVMLLVFTSNANNSDEIKKELVLAGRHRVTVVPVRVEDVVPNDAFTYELATRQWIDLFKDWERQIDTLANRLGDILQTEKPSGGGVSGATTPRPPARKPNRQPLIFGAAAAAVVIVAGGAALYLRPHPAPMPTAALPAAPSLPTAATQMAPPHPSPPPQLAAQTPPVAASAPQIAMTPPPAAAPAAPPDPDDAAWTAALGAGTREAYGGYLKSFAAGSHAAEAQIRLADAIRTDASPSQAFDGTWQTTWTCTNYGKFPGYSYQFAGQVKDGAYHGQHGRTGDPGVLQLDGRIEADGSAGFYGKGIVGSAIVALGAARGTEYFFHALGNFSHGVGDGKRLEGRPCTLSLTRE